MGCHFLAPQTIHSRKRNSLHNQIDWFLSFSCVTILANYNYIRSRLVSSEHSTAAGQNKKWGIRGCKGTHANIICVHQSSCTYRSPELVAVECSFISRIHHCNIRDCGQSENPFPYWLWSQNPSTTYSRRSPWKYKMGFSNLKNRSGPSLTCCPPVPPKESRVPTPSRGQPLSLGQHEGICAASLAEAVNQTLALSRRNCICYLCYST